MSMRLWKTDTDHATRRRMALFNSVVEPASFVWVDEGATPVDSWSESVSRDSLLKIQDLLLSDDHDSVTVVSHPEWSLSLRRQYEGSICFKLTSSLGATLSSPIFLDVEELRALRRFITSALNDSTADAKVNSEMLAPLFGL